MADYSVYPQGGGVVLKGGNAVPAPWQRIIPDTMGEGYRVFACQKSAPMSYTIPDTPRYGAVENYAALIKGSK